MQKIITFFFAFCFLISCSIPVEVHKSENEKYQLKIYVGDREGRDKYILAIALFDNEDNELDYIVTGASNVMKWAFLWIDENTLAIDSHDVGVLAWKISDQKKLIQITPNKEIADKANKAFNKKYNR
jgi:hypothetical protein